MINAKSGQTEYLIPEQTEHMIPEMAEHLKPEHKHYNINAKRLYNLITNRLLTLNRNRVLLTPEFALWMFIQFIYYCFLRSNEIRQLEHRYIHLDGKGILIPSNISKNGKGGYVSIPDTFYTLSLESEYFNREQRYIFQAKFKIKPISKNVMGNRFHRLITELHLGKDYTLYSWKHSGVVAAYNAGIDIKTIQNQCRHQSLEQTDIYLKSLGLGVSQAINKIPQL